MTVMQFWQEIGVSAAVSARVEEVLREKKALLSGLPLERWRTAPYEEGLSVLKEALGEDEDGMKLFAAQSMQALLALREYEKRGIGREIFLATMAFMARFSGGSARPQRARRMDVGLVVPPSARAPGVPPRRARIRDDGRGGVRRQAVGRKHEAHLFAYPCGCRSLGRRGGRLARYGKGVLFQILPRFCGCGICVRVVDALPRAL